MAGEQPKPSAELQQFMAQEQVKAHLQQTVARLTDEASGGLFAHEPAWTASTPSLTKPYSCPLQCWDKCISSPGASLTGRPSRPPSSCHSPLTVATAHSPATRWGPRCGRRQLPELEGADLPGQLCAALPRDHAICGQVLPEQGATRSRRRRQLLSARAHDGRA